MKKSLSILFAVLLAVAVLVPVYAVADDNVPAPAVPAETAPQGSGGQ